MADVGGLKETGVGAKEEEEEGSDEIGLISRRAEAFRVKMLKHFQLLDVFDEGGVTGAEMSDSPNLQTVDIVEDGLRKPMMATEPNALVQFHVYTDKVCRKLQPHYYSPNNHNCCVCFSVGLMTNYFTSVLARLQAGIFLGL